MSSRPPLTWVGAVTGFTTQMVVLTVVTVVLAHDAATVDPERDASDPLTRAFLELFGGLFYAIGAVVTGVLALALVLVLLLSIRTGGSRLAGLIVGLILQVPLVWFSFGAIENGAGTGEVVTLVGGALVLLAVLVPATWRWCRRPRVSPVLGSPYPGGHPPADHAGPIRGQ